MAVCRLKTKNSLPILGRELAHAVPPGLCRDPEGLAIFLWADNGAGRFLYLLKVDRFQGYAGGWFSAGWPEQALNQWPVLPVGKGTAYSSRSRRLKIVCVLYAGLKACQAPPVGNKKPGRTNFQVF
jgi:hypothetical protein